MRRVVRTPRAKADLIELWTYVAARNPSAADRILDLIDEKLAVLAVHPGLGPARADIGKDVRLFPVKRYVVLYRKRPDGIEVVRVVHGMRRLKGLV
jgi:toxin ParE1/3/4